MLTVVTTLLSVTAVDATASWDCPEWTLEEVDSFGGLSTSAGLSAQRDAQGRLHVSYYSIKGADLMYAQRTRAGWSVEVVDEYQVVGADCSIAVDGEGTPHICYYDKTNEELEYARRNGTTWDVEMVDWLSIVGSGTAIAIAPGGVPYMVYIGARVLRVACPGEDGWNVTEVDADEGHVSSPSIAFDHQGRPHIIYLGVGRVKHATLSGGNWTTETVDGLTGPTISMSTDLAIRSDGGICCCYPDRGGTAVVFASKQDQNWSAETIDEGFLLGDLAMELDGRDRPHISYLDLAMTGSGDVLNTVVWYASMGTGSWTRAPVMNGVGSRGILLDLVLAGNDLPQVLFVAIEPAAMEAHLFHGLDWTGEHVEPFSRDPSEWEVADGDAGGDQGDGSVLPSFLLVVLLALGVTVVLVIVGRHDGPRGRPD